jgi:hypothetical protein
MDNENNDPPRNRDTAALRMVAQQLQNGGLQRAVGGGLIFKLTYEPAIV